MNFTKEDVARKILEHVDYYLHFAEVGTDADQRNYEVSYEKIRKKGFETTVDLDRGIAELVRAAQADRVPEPVRQRLSRGSRPVRPVVADAVVGTTADRTSTTPPTPPAPTHEERHRCKASGPTSA